MIYLLLSIWLLLWALNYWQLALELFLISIPNIRSLLLDQLIISFWTNFEMNFFQYEMNIQKEKVYCMALEGQLSSRELVSIYYF